MKYDVVVVGGGPAGLAFTRGLEGSGLTVAVVERQPLAALREPADDGREIALTHRSVETLETLGAWQRIDPAAVSPSRHPMVRSRPEHRHAVVERPALIGGADAAGRGRSPASRRCPPPGWRRS